MAKINQEPLTGTPPSAQRPTQADDTSKSKRKRQRKQDAKRAAREAAQLAQESHPTSYPTPVKTEEGFSSPFLARTATQSSVPLSTPTPYATTGHQSSRADVSPAQLCTGSQVSKGDHPQFYLLLQQQYGTKCVEAAELQSQVRSLQGENAGLHSQLAALQDEMNRLKSEQASADDAAAQTLEKSQQKQKEISDHRRFYEKKLGEACGFATGLVAQDTECELSPPLQDNISKWVAALPDLVKTKVGGKNWLNISTQKQRTIARIQTVRQQHVKSTSHRPTATSTAQADCKAAEPALPKPETQGQGAGSGSQTLGQNDSSKRSSQQDADTAADQTPADGTKASIGQKAPQTRARSAAPVVITDEATPQPSQRLQKTVIPSTPVGPPSSQDSFQDIADVLPEGEDVPMENDAAVLKKQREALEDAERKKWKMSKEKARKLSQNAASTLVQADANANSVAAASKLIRPGPTKVAMADDRRIPVEISVAAGTQNGGHGDLQQNVEPTAESRGHVQSGRRAEKAAVSNSTRGRASEQVNTRQAPETVDLTTNDSDAQPAVESEQQTQNSQTNKSSTSEQQNKAEHARPAVQSQVPEATPPKQVGLARKRSAAAERLVQMRNSSRSAQPPKRKATTQSPQGTQPKPSKKPKAKKNQDIATLLQSQQKRSNPPASQSEVSDPEPPPVTTPTQGPSRWGATLDRMAREPPLNPRKRFLNPHEVRERRPPVTPPQPKSQHPGATAAAAANQDSVRSTGSTVYAYEPNVQELEEAETRASTEFRKRTQRQLANLGASPPPPAVGSKGPKKSVVDLTA
ncbi:hypothetical protein KC323_g8710 [Hortaea werneckii]|nr:hypothetical protein KC323_g8710 [Hortaea werneckii]